MHVYFLNDFVIVLSMSCVYLEDFIHSSHTDAKYSEQTTMSLKTHLKTVKEQGKINLLHQPQQGASIYGSIFSWTRKYLSTTLKNYHSYIYIYMHGGQFSA